MNPAQRQRRTLDKLRLPRFTAGISSGPFILALEGPNGSGKSTLCASLSRRLAAPACLGTDAAWFVEPFKTRMIRDAQWFASAMFFLSGCFEQVRRLQERSEPLVIMDRSIWSTLAVHAATDAERLERLLLMLEPIADEVRVPDLTLVLEASFATCQSRIRSWQYHRGVVGAETRRGAKCRHVTQIHIAASGNGDGCPSPVCPRFIQGIQVIDRRQVGRK